jgi:hypothetical protein
MEDRESITIAAGFFCAALYIASYVLAVMFLLRHRENRWRWLPCFSIIALYFILNAPESGGSDVRFQWHNAALLVAWNFWVLYLAFILLRTGKARLLIALRSVLGVMALFTLAGASVSLVESWGFLHSLR